MDEDENECLPIPRRYYSNDHNFIQICICFLCSSSLIHRIRDHPIENSPPDRRSSHLFLNNSSSSDYDIDQTIQTPLQLIALYEKTIEFAAKNKINAKNAFHFPLVERLPEILDIIAFDENNHSFDHHHQPNFVKAGNVIDTR